MDPHLSTLFFLLSLFWFLVYWILGGVFFGLIAILRLGRVRKVRFSCLFTLLAGVCAVSSAYYGVSLSHGVIAACTTDAHGRAQILLAMLGCGFGGLLLAFLMGALALTLGGFVFMSISRTKTKPWIVLQPEEAQEIPEAQEVPETQTDGDIHPSKFF